MEDSFGFARLLQSTRQRNGKTRKELSREHGFSINMISGWESGRGYPIFPRKEMLPFISLAYGISEDCLIKALELSKEGRKEELSARRNTKNRSLGPSESDCFPGGIGSRSSLTRSNSQVTNYRYGRK